jgi:hypothetical protein
LDRVGWILAALLGLAWAVALVRRTWRRWRRTWRTRRAFRRERDASRVLEGAGFRIDAVQPALDWRVWVDDEPRDIELRADYLVSRDGCCYVAEVKTGNRAPRIETAATRRQLLEYATAYDADGVLLVDMERRRISEIRFRTTCDGDVRRASSA